jgi:hypothetical protein|tara:strand:- start:565 stop:726 length:162 start_codon:yes stop_codon:yes gene_type:complete
MSTIEVKEDPCNGDLFLDLPADLLEKVDWKIGDTINWTEEPNGNWILEKVSDG